MTEKNEQNEFVEVALSKGKKKYQPPRMSVEEYDCHMFLCGSPDSLNVEIDGPDY